LVSQADLNKKSDLEIVRGGKPMTIPIQIKEQPAGYLTGRVTPQQPQQPQQPPTQQTPGNKDENDNALGGIHVGELSPALARQLDLPNGVSGVVVTAVDSDSGAADLQKGDVIEQVNQQPIKSVAEYSKIVQGADPTQPVVLSVCRHRARSFLVLRPR
jgi:serine protease Do